jgi:hypothetical protein
VRIGAGGLQTGVSGPVQALWLCAGHPRASPDCHGKEAFAGAAEGLGFVSPARFEASTHHHVKELQAA